jgi:D-galactarolactone isomerase
MEIADAERYRRFMQWIGIERVVITQGNAHQFDNRNLVACLKTLGEVAKGIAVIKPQQLLDFPTL